MAIYHCNISNVSRSCGSNSCATLSYISGKKIYDERLGKTFNYGRKERVIYCDTLLPDYAHEEWANAEVLFNSVEKYEKAINARTAKKIEVALPREFDLELQIKVLEEYINKNLVADGYAASYAIHSDKKNNNPHAHILIPNRQINKNGEWGSKRKMEYALDENGERIPRLDENGEQKTDKNGRKQWVRISAEQNPLDKKEKLEQLRKAWADECNNFLGEDEKIDHRSYASQGKDLEPTIHIGYAASEMEKRGEVSDRVEHNKFVHTLNIVRQRIKSVVYEIKQLRNEILALEKESEIDYIDRFPEEWSEIEIDRYCLERDLAYDQYAQINDAVGIYSSDEDYISFCKAYAPTPENIAKYKQEEEMDLQEKRREEAEAEKYILEIIERWKESEAKKEKESVSRSRVVYKKEIDDDFDL